MYPELFKIGSFSVATYGVMIALAMLMALFVASRLARHSGLSSSRIYDVGLWSILGGVVGSRVLLVLTDSSSSFLSADILRSGGVFYGGLIGGFMAMIAAVRFYRLPFLKVADAFAPGVALGQAIGRIGCFASGDSWGKPTDLPWGVRFTDAANAMTGVPISRADGSPLYLHPVQLYESFSMCVGFALLFWLHRRRSFNGQVLAAYAIYYALVRFVVEFLRNDPRSDVLGLTTATGLSTSQLISLALAGGAAIFLIYRFVSGRRVRLSHAALLIPVAAMVLLTGSAAVIAQQEKPIRINTRLMDLSVSVTDSRGVPVPGLTAEQFTVLVDGREQKIAHFYDGAHPVQFSVVLDLRPFAGEKLTTLLASLKLLQKGLAANEELSVTTFDERGSTTFGFVPTDEQIRTALYARRGEPNTLYDAICSAAEKLDETEGRSILIVISDGANGRSRHDFATVRRHMGAFGVPVYGILLNGSQSGSTLIDLVQQKKFGRVNIARDSTALDRAATEDLTKKTGGMYHEVTIKSTSEVSTLLDHAAQDARQRYVIGFYLAEPTVGRRSIKVQVRPVVGGTTKLFPSYRRELWVNTEN